MNDSVYKATAPNAYRLLYAGFMAILAAGVGFSIRAGILGQWANQFGFTMSELGTITGGGLIGFGAVIILTSLFADRIGYGKILMLAFALHFLSAVLTLATPAFFAMSGKLGAYYCLFFAMIIFSVGNGLCEAVVNPLTATLFPKAKTHFLNILHAGWPAGLVLGGLASYFMSGGEVNGVVTPAVDWTIQMLLFLIPVIIYGIMAFGQRFPASEAVSVGVSTKQMLMTLLAPLMLFLIVIHAMVGYVELGTDSWIGKITGQIMGKYENGLALFVYTSSLMFVLRYVAGPIVHRISPLGLLFVSAVLGFVGLFMLGNIEQVASTFAPISALIKGTTPVMIGCIVAATIYGIGKTFLWPTMLAVASERFPNGGAVSIGVLGGVGMLSAGAIGGPLIGFKQDYFASQYLQQQSIQSYERYKSENANKLFGVIEVVGLDGAKVGILNDNGKELARVGELLQGKEKTNSNKEEFANHASLESWWADAKQHEQEDKSVVTTAGRQGGLAALRITAIIPAIMAVCYLLLIIGFKMRGGYQAIHLTIDSVEARKS